LPNYRDIFANEFDEGSDAGSIAIVCNSECSLCGSESDLLEESEV